MSKLWITNFILQWSRDIRHWIHVSCYNDETISSYYRKQGARIGKNCRFRIRFLAPEPYLIDIGDHVFISTGVILHTHDGGVWILREKYPNLRVFGPITIENNCIIGVRTQILPNVRIGRNSIVGAGSVVITDIPPNSIAMGVPARVVGSTLKHEEKCLNIWKEQKPPGLITDRGDSHWWHDKKNQKTLKNHLLKLFRNKEEGQR